MTQLFSKFNALLHSITHSRWLRWGVISLAIIAIIFVSLPYVIVFGIQHWFTSQGANYVEMEDVDFNPFTRKLLIYNLEVGDDAEPLIQVAETDLEFSWLPLLKSTVYFDDIVIKGVKLTLQKPIEGPLAIAGLKTTPSSNTKSENRDIGFGVNKLTLLNSQLDIKYDDNSSTLLIDNFSMGPLASSKPLDATDIKFSGNLDGGQVQLNGKMTPLNVNPSFSGNVHILSFPLETINPMLSANELVVDGYLDTDMNVDITLPLDNSDKAPSDLKYSANGKLTLRKISVTDINAQTSFVSATKINLVGAQIKTPMLVKITKTDLQDLSLSQISIPSQKKSESTLPLLQADNLSIQSFQFTDQNKVLIDTVAFTKATANLQRGTDGKWVTLQDTAPKPDTNTETPNKKLFASINQITLDNASVININDQMVSPAFKQTIKVNKFNLSHLNNSDEKSVTSVDFDGKIGGFTNFNLSGKLQPFASKTNINAVAKLNNLDLPPLSIYTKLYHGYVLNSGHIDTDINVDIIDDAIKGLAKIKISNLEMSAVDKVKSKALTTSLSLPLETAIVVLRDNDKTIRLKIPITGDINDPTFSYSDAVNQAIGKAAKTSAMQYLKYSLGPYGALIALTEIAGEIASSINLAPVNFKPGSDILDTDSIDYLKRVSVIMKERTDINIKVCGTAVNLDRTALLEKNTNITDEDLQSLATQRANAIKNHLVTVYEIQPKRLFICLPVVDSSDEAKPIANLTI